MKKYILCSLLLATFSSLESKAQDGIIAGDNALMITTLFNRLPDYEKVLGSQYIDDHFMTAIANKNAKQKHVLRYNNNTGYFEERKKNNEIISLPKSSFHTVEFSNGTVFELKEIPYKNDFSNEYLEVIGTKNDKMNLYKLQSIQFVDTYVAKNSYERNIQAHYKKNKPTFYIEIHKNLYAFQTKAGLQRILRKNNIDGTKINWKELNLSNKKDLIHFQNELITSIH